VLEAGAVLPGAARDHRRQAVLALLFGILAWVASVGGILLVIGGVNQANEGWMAMGVLIFFGAPLGSVIGIGQAAAAIRARGDHMILATIGLLIGGLHAGMMVGMVTLSVWNQ
jgi:hypothetical protein